MPNSFTPQQIEQFLEEFFDVVGARQYIGARYVPIFGRKGEETVEWDDLAPYEPLTVVMHQGSSYVSRRYVPTGVAIEDGSYWVQTYQFNAQIEQYRQAVSQLGDELEETNEALDNLRRDVDDTYVPFPAAPLTKYGTSGQVLETLGDGTTRWHDPVTVTAEIAGPIIDDWLDDHPEATTTIEDGAVTTQKIADGAVTDEKLQQSGGLLSMVQDSLMVSERPSLEWERGSIDTSGGDAGSMTRARSSYFTLPSNVTSVKALVTNNGLYDNPAASWYVYDGNGTFVRRGEVSQNVAGTIDVSNASKIRFMLRDGDNIIELSDCNSLLRMDVLSTRDLTTDNTLTLANRPADAKAAGDGIRGLDARVTEVEGATNGLVYTDDVHLQWVRGSISNYGADAGSAERIRSGYYQLPRNVIHLLVHFQNNGDYTTSLIANAYYYDSDGDFLRTHSVYVGSQPTELDVRGVRSVRFMVRDGTNVIDVEDGDQLLYLTVTATIDLVPDTTLSIPDRPADAKATGDAIREVASSLAAYEKTYYTYALTHPLCIGDSLTRGSSPNEDWSATTGTVPMAQNYPSFFGRMLGCSCTNAGFSGISASTWYTNWADTVTPTEDKPYKVPHYDFAEYDSFIIWLGTNNGFDPGDLDTAGTEANYYCQIIDAIYADYAAGHTDPRYGDEPLVVLCKVFATKSGYSLSATNEAIEAIADRYSLPVIDLSDLSFSLHPELHENVNNPHMGKAGYLVVADRIRKALGAWMGESPTRADFAETQLPFGA